MRADGGEHLLAGADVDALRRLVEQDQLRLDLEPLCQHDLLLVAAGKLAEQARRVARPHVEGFGQSARRRGSCRAREIAQPPRLAVEHRQGHIVGDGERRAPRRRSGGRPGTSTIPAWIAAFGVMRAGRARYCRRSSSLPPLARLGAVDEMHDIVVAGADQAGEPDDLAGPHRQREILDARAGEILDRARFSAPEVTCRRGRIASRSTCAPDDHAHDVAPCCASVVTQRSGHAPVAQHGDAVGDLHHLVDVVRDEDDAGAFGDDARAPAQKSFCTSAGRQEGRRLVEDAAGAASSASVTLQLVEGAHDGEQRALHRTQRSDRRSADRGRARSAQTAPGAPLRLLAAS